CAVERPGPTIPPLGGDGCAEEQLLGEADLIDELADGAVGLEQMMVEALERPLPALVAEARGQPTRLCAGLVDRDGVAGLGQIAGGRQPSDPRADDRDVHTDPLEARGWRLETRIAFTSLQPLASSLTVRPPARAPRPRARSRASRHAQAA